MKKKKTIQKIEKDKIIIDRASCCGMFRIEDDAKEIMFGEQKYKLEKVKILREENGERIFVYKGDEKWLVLSSELYDSAQRIFDCWFNKAEEFMIANEKDNPIILINEPMAIIIAPRIETDG